MNLKALLAGTGSAAVLAGCVLVANAVTGGPGTPAGIGVGLALGVAVTVIEVVLLRRAADRSLAAASRVQLGGAAVRMVLLFGVGLALQGSDLADANAFALVFGGSFFASLPWVALVAAAPARREVTR
jgi:hypothetical protein